MRKLLNLDYNVILNSHEDRTKDFTSRTGEKYTAIKPNINDKVANKLAGMVDFVGRIVIDGDKRTLNFKSNDVIFGGGRLDFGVNEIPLNWGELMKLYDDLSVDEGEKNRSNRKLEVPKNDNLEEKEAISTVEAPEEKPSEESPVRRRRRRTEDSNE